MASVAEAKSPTSVDDGVAVVEWLRQQNYVSAYGVSLGGASGGTHEAARGRARGGKSVPVNKAIARKNLAALQGPVLLLVGTKDNLIAVAEPFHELAVAMLRHWTAGPRRPERTAARRHSGRARTHGCLRQETGSTVKPFPALPRLLGECA